MIDFAAITDAVESVNTQTGGDVEPSKETDAALATLLREWGFDEKALNTAIGLIERKSAQDLLRELGAALAGDNPAQAGMAAFDALRATALCWLLVGFQLARTHA